ncbi:MAG: hypothetical protein WEB57_06500 [Pseudohongiellaceae bacterium]
MLDEQPLPPSRLRPASLLTVLFALVLPALSRQLPSFPESAAWVVWWLPVIPLSLWHWQYRLHRRRFWLRHHMNPESRWYRLLQGGYLMLPWSVLRAVFLAAMLLAGVLASTLSLCLIVLAPLLTGLAAHRLDRALMSALNPQALTLFSERSARWLALACLTALYALLSLFLPQPDYAGTDFSDAASQALYSAAAGSELVSLIQAADTLQTFLFHWSVQNLLQDDAGFWWLLGGWLSLLLKGAVFFLPAVELSLAGQRWLARR